MPRSTWSGGAPPDPLELRRELPRRDVQVRRRAPGPRPRSNRARVEHHADPAARTDVGRPEEALGVGVDQSLLRAERLRQPHREVLGAVVMVVEHREDLALAREPGGLAVRELLVRFGERHADLPQTLGRRWSPRRGRGSGGGRGSSASSSRPVQQALPGWKLGAAERKNSRSGGSGRQTEARNGPSSTPVSLAASYVHMPGPRPLPSARQYGARRAPSLGAAADTRGSEVLDLGARGSPGAPGPHPRGSALTSDGQRAVAGAREIGLLEAVAAERAGVADVDEDARKAQPPADSRQSTGARARSPGARANTTQLAASRGRRRARRRARAP